jgi:site-specific DNA recombinase
MICKYSILILVAPEIRLSKDHAVNDFGDDQHQICRDYAKKQGWKLAAKFDDVGISGAAFGNRPGVLEALKVMKAGDVLLVCDLSRLSRSSDLSPALDRLKHRGARCIGVQDGYDSDSRSARMQAGLSGIMSAEFRSMIGDRTRSALEMRARDGRATGGKAFSDPKLVKEIFQRFACGESLKRIASDFNARNIPSPGAAWKARSNPRGKWLVSALHALVQNEIYIGRRIWNKSQFIKDPDTGKRIRRERPESEWVVTKCEPLIDRPTWDAAQRRFQGRTMATRSQRQLLSGILECGLCGSKMIISGGLHRRYRCSQNHHGGAHACAFSQTFPQKEAEHLLLAPIIQIALSDKAIKVGLSRMRQRRTEAARERTARPAESASKRELRELERLVSQGILSAETAQPSIDAIKRRPAASAQDVIEIAPLISPEVWRDCVLRMRSILMGDDVGAARDVMRELVDAVPVTPGEDSSYVNLGFPEEIVALKTGTGPRISSGSGGRI